MSMQAKRVMNIDTNNISFYPALIQDYINGRLNANSIISWDYSLDEIIKKASYRKFGSRTVLVDRLVDQNKTQSLSKTSSDNISLLREDNTFTVCTGHQLSIFAGPAYFVSKIIDTIKLAKTLNEQDNKNNYIPVFWLASEDHDFEEISSVKFFNNPFKWDQNISGAVGNIGTDALRELSEEIKKVLGTDSKAEKLNQSFHKAYCSGKTLKEATRTLVNSLMGEHGIVIIDGDDPQLKQLLFPVINQEIKEKITLNNVEKQIKKLSSYKIQAAPREINLFYLEQQYRERIVVEDDKVKTIDNKHEWSTKGFLDHASQSPEKISPNVLLRPVYQELCLPNVAYIGGAGEISYWLELPPLFKALSIEFPLPVVRNSYLYLSQKQLNTVQKSNLALEDFFVDEGVMLKRFLEKTSGESFDFSQEKKHVEELFEGISVKAIDIDQNLSKVVQGELKRSLSALENMEKRFRNAEKNKQSQETSSLQKIRSVIFPNEIFQERTKSFFDFELQSSKELIETVLENNKPLENSIKVVVY